MHSAHDHTSDVDVDRGTPDLTSCCHKLPAFCQKAQQWHWKQWSDYIYASMAMNDWSDGPKKKDWSDEHLFFYLSFGTDRRSAGITRRMCETLTLVNWKPNQTTNSVVICIRNFARSISLKFVIVQKWDTNTRCPGWWWPRVLIGSPLKPRFMRRHHDVDEDLQPPPPPETNSHVTFLRCVRNYRLSISIYFVKHTFLEQLIARKNFL